MSWLPMLPVYASKMGGFFFITFGVIVLIAALVTINPIWNYGPYGPVSRVRRYQPDWYIGFARCPASGPAAPRVRALGPHLVVEHHLPGGRLGLFIVLVLIYPSSRRGSRAKA